MSSIKDLRKKLHQYPELSGSEGNTAQLIHDFLLTQKPDEIIEGVGGHGVAAIYKFNSDGPVVGIRCELDALPIQEANEFSHRSFVDGVSHKCGHDGHMAIVVGLATWLKDQSFKSGKVVLLFQPAEETGKGADTVMKDRLFKDLQLDSIFALHNIPGEHKHAIITMDKGFSAEVQSFALSLEGIESHASEPEQGVNPAICTSKILTKLDALNVSDPMDENFAVLTPVYTTMGSKAYGISPAKAELHYTIRTWNSAKLYELKSKIFEKVEEICKEEEIKFGFDWFEYFPASENDPSANRYVTKAAKDNGFDVICRPYPFKFGEDFGWYSNKYKTTMFGLGAGKETPALHSANYDFPDEIIDTGIDMFKSIISQILGEG